jgi:hypothetical protein
MRRRALLAGVLGVLLLAGCARQGAGPMAGASAAATAGAPTGKLLTFTGTLTRYGAPDAVFAILETREAGPQRTALIECGRITVWANFEKPPSALERLGDPGRVTVSVRGKLHGQNGSNVHLTECELVSGPR